MIPVHCSVPIDYGTFTKTLNKCQILSPLAIQCITVLDYKRCLVSYLWHLTFVFWTITYRSSLNLNFYRLKRSCTHSRAKYVVCVLAIFTTFSADILLKPHYRVFIGSAL